MLVIWECLIVALSETSCHVASMYIRSDCVDELDGYELDNLMDGIFVGIKFGSIQDDNILLDMELPFLATSLLSSANFLICMELPFSAHFQPHSCNFHKGTSTLAMRSNGPLPQVLWWRAICVIPKCHLILRRW